MDNGTDNEEIWRWHRPAKKKYHAQMKCHLVAYRGRESGHTVRYTACGADVQAVGRYEEANNDATDPCKNCLRWSAGFEVGKG